MSEVPFVRHELIASDGVRLGGREYEPRGDGEFTALLLPGIGVPQRALRHLAAFLAAEGIRAFSIDYRGMGDSTDGAPGASLRAWAERDAVAGLEFVERRWQKPVVHFGHSFGGQVVGLADAFSRAKACVFIASQFGQAKHWDGFQRVKVAAFWRVILPLASSLFASVPGWTGAGEALPRGVASEWARWGRSEHWYLDHVERARQRLADFSKPILAYAASDDPIAPPRAVGALLATFESAAVERRDLRPSDLGVRTIGHFGLLRPPAERLWKDMLDFARGSVVRSSERSPATAPEAAVHG
jgi:predicted alpha/beta hydrolase